MQANGALSECGSLRLGQGLAGQEASTVCKQMPRQITQSPKYLPPLAVSCLFRRSSVTGDGHVSLSILFCCFEPTTHHRVSLCLGTSFDGFAFSFEFSCLASASAVLSSLGLWGEGTWEALACHRVSFSHRGNVLCCEF